MTVTTVTLEVMVQGSLRDAVRYTGAVTITSPRQDVDTVAISMVSGWSKFIRKFAERSSMVAHSIVDTCGGELPVKIANLGDKAVPSGKD